MSCSCDEFRCSPTVEIPAGLSRLPRSPGQFPDWRRALLAAVGREPRLSGWRGREAGDLGLMLIEMAAYVFDVASFYDQLVADESYLPTARLSGSQRQLIALLGYQPRPAIGAAAWLAAEADGTFVVDVPAGTAFRSGEFEGHPPQVFELAEAATIDPRVNRLEIRRVPATFLPSSLSHLLARAVSVRVRPSDRVLLDIAGSLHPATVAGVTPEVLRLRDSISRVTFASAVTPPAGQGFGGLRVFKPGATAGAWRLTPASGESPVISGAQLSLNALVPLRAGESVLIEDGPLLVARRVTAVTEVRYTFLVPQVSTLTSAAGATSTLTSPAVKVGVTQLTFSEALPAGLSVSSLTVHYSMVEALRVVTPLKDTLEEGDPVEWSSLVNAPRVRVERLLLEDVHGDGIVAGGTFDAANRLAVITNTSPWGRSLWAPVQLYGNALYVTRGESVTDERLGSGDATQAIQTFRLKKGPLTYLSASTRLGRLSTLVIQVSGIRWHEVETFYGATDHDTVYTVRHDEEGHTDIHFGGGARLPTGAEVIANYRFGAGASLPPAGSLQQVARPVAGLRKVHNVLPAFGGSDAEGSAELAARAPRSALLMGRAISLVDLEVAAAQQAGVRAAQAAWRWDSQGLRPAAVVQIIGDRQLLPVVRSALRALAEDDVSITVIVASPQPARLDLDVSIHPDHAPANVAAALRQVLCSPVTLPGTGGLLRAERLGPNGVLFQSHVLREVRRVEGVTGVRGLLMDGTPFVQTGRLPELGAYFEFATPGEGGGVRITCARGA